MQYYCAPHWASLPDLSNLLHWDRLEIKEVTESHSKSIAHFEGRYGRIDDNVTVKPLQCINEFVGSIVLDCGGVGKEYFLDITIREQHRGEGAIIASDHLKHAVWWGNGPLKMRLLDPAAGVPNNVTVREEPGIS
jgi:hypothetical protein